jgi:hypothetical protein
MTDAHVLRIPTRSTQLTIGADLCSRHAGHGSRGALETSLVPPPVTDEPLPHFVR